MRSAKRLFIAWGALIIVLLGAAAPASAHAALVSAEPSDGSVVASAPSQALLTFSEGVLLSDDSLRVLDPSGKDVEQGTAHHAASGPNTATVNLRQGLAQGTYTVAWKVVSADTHPVSGAFTFSVGAPSKTSAALPQQQVGGGAVGLLYGFGRWIAYGGFAVLVGTSAFVGLCWPRGARLRAMRRLAVGGWAALTGSTLALLLLRGPYTNGTRLATMLDLSGLQAAAASTSGVALLSRLLLLAAAAVVLSVLFGAYTRRVDAEKRRDLGFGLAAAGAVIAIGVALTWSASEHASVGIQTAVAIPVDVVHLLAMAVWLGGLAALATGLYRNSGVERTAVRRFSRIAFGCVLLLVTTGVYQSWRQLGSWQALTDTSYGRLLLVKIALVAAMVGAAWFSRRWTGRLSEHDANQEGLAEQPDQTARPADSREPVEVMAAQVVSGDPRRAAQLARQRRVFAAARAKKQRDADPTRSRLRRSVFAETAVAVAVLAVTTLLSNSEPGRTAEAAAAAQPTIAGMSMATAGGGGPGVVTLPYDTGGATGQGTAEVHIDPADTGSNQLSLVLTDPSGTPVDVPEVDIALTLPSRGIGPLTVPLRHLGTGAWVADNLRLPMPGQWQLAVTVRTSDIDEVTETTNVAIN